MKRFFCLTCNQQRRVRRLPHLKTPATLANLATGYCRWHDRNVSRTDLMDRSKVVAGLGSTRKISASSQKSKSK